MRGLRVIALRTAAFVAVLFCFIVVLPVGWMFWGRLVDDPRYAGDFFDDLLPYDTVIASRYWGKIGGWSCTYAIVRLTENPAAMPATRSRSGHGWRYTWGPDWQPTPAPPLGETTRDAMGACAPEWPAGTYETLQTTLDTEGAFYNRDPVGETVMIYAPNQRIAARIRFGD